MTRPNTRRKNAAALLLAGFLGTVVPSGTVFAADLKIGISQYPSTLHPLFDEMVAKSLVLGMALRPVTAFGPDWQAHCLLCKEMPSLENGLARVETRPDGKEGIAATYTIRDDVFWDDGTPVTVKDILFGWKVGKHPQSGVGNGSFFSEDIADITTAGDKSFTIHFAKKICEFAAIADFFALPAHLEEKIFDADPLNYKNKTLYVTAPATSGLYWGPYRIAQAETGSALRLEKNPAWKGKAPAFDKISFRAIENVQALAANLLSGDVDYVAGELGLSLDQAVAMEKRLPKGKFTVTYKPSLTYEHIDLNLDNPLFKDVRVRRAIMHAMNRDAINQTIYDGRQPVAVTSVNPLDTVYTPEVATYAYDPAAAQTLLSEAGWIRGDDGVCKNEKGEKLSFTLTTTAGNKTRETILQALQSDLAKSCIETRIENQPPRVLFGDTTRQRTFQGGIMYAWMSSPRNIPKTTLHSTMIPAQDNNFAGQNYPGYRNPEADQLIDDLEITCEPDKNMALWHKLQKLYAEDLPALPLYYRADAFFVPVWLKNLTPTGHMHPSTLAVEDWEDAR